MRELTEDEEKAFSELAWVICKKGHLPIPAILRFTKTVTKKHIKLFLNLSLIKNHRTDTYELTLMGIAVGKKLNPRLRQ